MSLKARLAALETALHTADEVPRHYVVYIGDAEPEGLQPWDTIVYLPRKASSAAVWYEQVREQFGYLMDGPPHHSPGL